MIIKTGQRKLLKDENAAFNVLIDKNDVYVVGRNKEKETSICKVFQKYIEEKRACKSFLWLRNNKQAPIDYLGRLYDKETWKTIKELAVEVRSLNLSKEGIEKWYWYIIPLFFNIL